VLKDLVPASVEVEEKTWEKNWMDLKFSNRFVHFGKLVLFKAYAYVWNP
jgi:hypothetical protein